MQPVIIRSEGSFRTEVETETHRFAVDEPVSAGGTDEGPTPYDLLSAALGACTSMTLHFVAKRDNIPLEGVEISITNDRCMQRTVRTAPPPAGTFTASTCRSGSAAR